MDKNNEITIKITISDSLLTKFTNVLMLASNPHPMGLIVPQLANQQQTKEKASRPIGFQK